MTEQEKGQTLNEHKTLCCNSSHTRKEKFDYRCNNCNQDITMELFYLYQAL